VKYSGFGVPTPDRVEGVGFRVQGFEFRNKKVFRVQGSGLGVQGSNFVFGVLVCSVYS